VEGQRVLKFSYASKSGVCWRRSPKPYIQSCSFSSDSVLKIQSVRAQLDHLDGSKLPEIEELKECLENADDNMRDALKSSAPKKLSGG
jgi:hypothetical protein